MRTVHALAVALVALSITSTVAAQPAQEDAERSASADPVALSLARALESRVTVWRTPRGRVVHVSHCRAVQSGCRSRIALFARWIAEVARERGIDPFILAAMAVRESGLDPFATGPAGEMGIIQLHPHGIGHRAQFVRSEAYRIRCRRDPGACQREILEIGADHLAEAIAQCGGLEEGLGAYNSGECRETPYSRRILRERASLLELAKTDAPPPALRNVD